MVPETFFSPNVVMNFMLILKTLLILAILSMLVYMGMYNRQPVVLRLPQLFIEDKRLPAALMYFGFFGVGFLAGTIVMAGAGKKGGKSK